ncbi:F-box protein At2g26850-like, partial [Prosopis cineraria]|uniref:F-box protein At2g26850-like n=1 Tax=Prosopis cineraria TaxID=364024 RepID=UPI0024101D53
WAYATIGHLETCDDENENNHCGCGRNDLVVVEFKQYAPRSRLRRLVLSRNNYREHDGGMARLRLTLLYVVGLSPAPPRSIDDPLRFARIKLRLHSKTSFTIGIVCNLGSLRGPEEEMSADDLWKQHIQRKWGPLLGEAIYKEWQRHMTSAKQHKPLGNDHSGSVGTISGDWPRLSLGSYLEDSVRLRGSLSSHFMKALYFSLESGKFWFPAQFYRGTVFVSCGHGLISYDSGSDSFHVRKKEGAWELLEKNMGWDMARAPPIEIAPNALHVSDPSNLKPGDHIEIQRRTFIQTSYDRAYATIGHLETCGDENDNHCGCDRNDLVVVEFKQYAPTSRLRRRVLSRNNHREHDDGLGYLYGGIRKIHSQQHIDAWTKIFPQHHVSEIVYIRGPPSPPRLMMIP